MGFTIEVGDTQSARIAEQIIETQPPDQIEFVSEGVVTLDEDVLGEFTGTTLRPTQVDFSTSDAQTVSIDLTGPASLRLDDVDVGVAMPDTDTLSSGVESLDPTTDEGAPLSIDHGAIAFTVEGEILRVPDAQFEQLDAGDPTLESITFALDNTVKRDGGPASTPLLEFTLLGYGITIYRTGWVEVGTGGVLTDVRPI